MTLRIGNAQAFWGDRPNAAFQLLKSEPSLDYLTMDYLSEVSLSILAAQKEKDSSKGYAADFLDVITSIAPLFRQGCRCKIICNAGGLNPYGCGKAVVDLIKEEGLSLTVGIVSGDDVLDFLQKNPTKSEFNNLETGESLALVKKPLITANAYLGADPIVSLLKQGADIIITGRVADPSLVVAPAMHLYGWKKNEWNKIAAATIAGHLIECGTQVCGGFSTNWLKIPNPETMGYPIIEIDADGNMVVTKSKNAGGSVTIETVKEQLLYEIGDPAAYISPDVIANFTSLHVEEIAKNRIQITGATGNPATDYYKVSATFFAGYKSEAFLTVVGKDAEKKAQACGEVILQRLQETKQLPSRFLVEVLGNGGALHGVLSTQENSIESVLRIAVADPKKKPLEAFSKEIAPMVTSGPQGVTGYTSGRPKMRPMYAYWPCLIEKKLIAPVVTLLKN